MVSIKRIKAADINLAHGLTLISQEKGAKVDYERRIIALWNAGVLPHIIENIMKISATTLSAELKHYDSIGINLNKKRLTDEQRVCLHKEGSLKFSRDLCEQDYQFYLARHPTFGITHLASIIGVPLTLLKSIINLMKELSVTTPPLLKDSTLRNADICNEYELRKNERGVITKLATKFNLSRRAIDIILVKAELKDVKIKRPNKLTDKQTSIIASYKNTDLEVKGVTPNSAMTEIAMMYDVSVSYVHLTLVQAGIVQTAKKRLTSEELEIRNALLKKQFSSLHPNKENVALLASEHNIAVSTLDKLLRKWGFI